MIPLISKTHWVGLFKLKKSNFKISFFLSRNNLDKHIKKTESCLFYYIMCFFQEIMTLQTFTHNSPVPNDWDLRDFTVFCLWIYWGFQRCTISHLDATRCKRREWGHKEINLQQLVYSSPPVWHDVCEGPLALWWSKQIIYLSYSLLEFFALILL